MENYNKIKQVLNPILLFISFVVEQAAFSFILKKNINSDIINVIISILITAMIYIVLIILIYVFFKIPLVKKLIIGKEYIEGTWIEILYEEDNNVKKLVSCGLTVFLIKGNEISYTGTNYDNDLTPIMTFAATALHYHYPKINYTNVTQLSGCGNGKSGSGQLSFIDINKQIPTEHLGFFHNGNEICNYYAKKITDRKIIKKLRNSKDFKDCFRQQLQCYFPTYYCAETVENLSGKGNE